jgi:hypothetical protein
MKACKNIPYRQYYDRAAGICKQCASNCKTCIDRASNCANCATGYDLRDRETGAIVPILPGTPNYYGGHDVGPIWGATTSSHNALCAQECEATCRSCDASQICQSCDHPDTQWLSLQDPKVCVDSIKEYLEVTKIDKTEGLGANKEEYLKAQIFFNHQLTSVNSETLGVQVYDKDGG